MGISSESVCSDFFGIRDKCRILTFHDKKVTHFNVLRQKVTYLNERNRKAKEERERGKRKRKEKEERERGKRKRKEKEERERGKRKRKEQRERAKRKEKEERERG